MPTAAGLLSRVRSLFARPSRRADTLTTSFGGSSYDGAVTNQMRSDLRAFPLTARQEMTRFNRLEILRKVRALEANLGLIARMKGQVGKYSVGMGIFPVPHTTDSTWNERAVDKFDDWANNRFVCDVAGAMTFWERQRYHAETFFAEGESFDALISSSVTGAPQLQLFDNSEIGGVWGNEKDGFIDGVRASAFNRPLEYLIATTDEVSPYGPAKLQAIDAASVIHLIRRKRANQLRAISPFAPGVNCAIDKMDIRSLTTQAAKLHEQLGLVVSKESGEAGKAGISGKLAKEFASDDTLTKVNESFFGAAVQYLKSGEKIDIVASDRPTQNLMEFLQYLIRDICLGTGLSYEIVWNMADLGGATARIALADAQWFFDGVQDSLNELLNQRVWVWWCASMMKNGQLPKCRDARWWTCDWQGPAKLTADEGYSAQAQIDRLYSGQDNWSNQYARNGRAWKPAVLQRIDEVAWLNAECAKKGVDPALIFAPKPGTVVTPEETAPSSSTKSNSTKPSAEVAPQTINLSVDAKQSARRIFKINRADGSEITGEISEPPAPNPDLDPALSGGKGKRDQEHDHEQEQEVK